MHRLAPFVLMVAGGVLLTLTVGCEQETAKDKDTAKGKGALQDVRYSIPVQRDVAEFVYYTGRINAKFAATVQARVTGLLLRWNRKETDDEVTEGELLAEIDPEPFAAQRDAASASVEQSNASKEYAVATYKRFKTLKDTIKGSVSDQELEQYMAQKKQAEANLKLAQENLKLAELNLKWTKITAPITGRMSRHFKEKGNIINQDSTQLTTIVSMDPMFTYFDMDEPTLLRIKQAIDNGEMSPIKEGKNKIKMKLVDENDYSHEGALDFLDSQVNPGTGSISVRGVFDNPKIKGGAYKFLPGMFVRVQLPLGKAKSQYLVKDQVVLTEQQGKYVWVIDQENKARKRSVRTGQLQDDGMRVLLQNPASKDGKNWLKMDDKIVVNQLLRMNDGLLLVNPVQVDMQPKQDTAK